MNILTTYERVQLADSTLLPFTRYIVPADVAIAVSNHLNAAQVPYVCSSFNSYERRYAGQKSGTLALFRHQAWGEQLMTSAVVNVLKHVRPELRVDVYCSSEVISIWNKVTRAYPCPMLFDTIRQYPFHAMYEGMLENNAEPDQSNAIDDMLAFIGINPEEVPDNLKVPVIHGESEDYNELGFLNLRVPYVVLQLQAGNPNRSIPPDLLADIANTILNTTDHHVILVGQKQPNQSLGGLGLIESSRFHNTVGRLTKFRSLIPLIRHAKAVICPDSSIGHLAACFPEVPVVSIWGLFDPSDRVKYYPNHRPIFNQETCPHAPCHNHDFTLPQVKCKDASNSTQGAQQWCNVMRSVTVEQVMGKLGLT